MKKRDIILVLIILTFISLVNPTSSWAQDNEDYDIYTVRSGDSIWSICQNHQADFRDTLAINRHFRNPDLIFPGDRVFIPRTPTRRTPQRDAQPEEREEQRRPEPQPEEERMVEVTEDINTMEAQVVELVNIEREKYGLEPYKHNGQVSNVARTKAEDMRDNNYFAHTSPTYGSPFEMLQEFNVQFTAAGENIAQGQPTAQAVMDAWMDSPGHRENILSEEFTYIGVGLAKDGQGNTYWVQMFIRP
ncbi:CAP domain-containing protein [Halonatronum saccharophilum]|uniref:CAP domain-containing protein n=1 Tax=Halonatronum saccharophilum TaxID=150060 RepID=UPI000489203B|nr:CAP domain-containing protein [Halonatronum saccharophilum]